MGIRQDLEMEGIHTAKKEVELSLFSDGMILYMEILNTPPKNYYN